MVLSVSAALPASAATADYAPGSHDIVGVGADTLQYTADFVDDGDYFHNPGTVYPGAAASLAPAVVLLTGTPSDGHAAYDDVRNLFIVYRFSDQTSTTNSAVRRAAGVVG
jgi:hypothetical protein